MYFLAKIHVLICCMSQPPDVKAEMARQKNDGAWTGLDGSSDSERVREFTRLAGQPTPDYPEVMNVEEVCFLGKMMLDEMMELMATRFAPADAKCILKTFIDERSR